MTADTLLADPLQLAFTGWSVPDRPTLSLGYVSVIGVALIVPATVLLAPVGARLAHAISPLALKRVFALFLLVTALRMFYELAV